MLEKLKNKVSNENYVSDKQEKYYDLLQGNMVAIYSNIRNLSVLNYSWLFLNHHPIQENASSKLLISSTKSRKKFIGSREMQFLQSCPLPLVEPTNETWLMYGVL